MRRLWMVLVVLAVLVASVAAFATGTWGFALAAVVGVLGFWQFGKCHHAGPLGLLPPTTQSDGSTVPARWFCDACGKTWPASFEHDQRPVPRFHGYDPTKAVNAAKRAEDLARRQRALAVKRAGLEPPPRPKSHIDAAEVVAIRRFAK
jgi:hypothetical protein